MRRPRADLFATVLGCSTLVGAILGCAGGPPASAVAAGSAAPSAAPSASASAPALPDEIALDRLRGHPVAIDTASVPPRLTRRAAEKLDEMVHDADGPTRVPHVRVYQRCAPALSLDPSLPPDRHVQAEGVRIEGDALAFAFLSGTEIDFQEDGGFVFRRPSGAPTCDRAGWSDVLSSLDARLATCIAACHADDCRTDCWCTRAVEANYAACISSPSPDDAACAGAFTTEWARCDVRDRDDG